MIRKQSVRAWPAEKKIEKLGIYSSCKADENCKCNGWKNPNPPPNPPKPDVPGQVYCTLIKTIYQYLIKVCDHVRAIM